MNICTTLEQSEKLLGLGLNPETADMKYFYWKNEENPVKKSPSVGFSKEISDNYIGTEAVYAPAWSLAKLLEILPDCVIKDGRGYWLECFKDEDTFVIKYWIKPNGICTNLLVEGHPDYVTCAVNAVCYLLETKLL